MRSAEEDRRDWNRLPLSVPIFVRGTDGGGNKFLEFANTLNISRGGALLRIRKFLPLNTTVSIEIPSFPDSPSVTSPSGIRDLKAEVIHLELSEQCYLTGLQFRHPLAQG